LIVALANDLGARLRPTYYAAIETRTYLDDDSEGVLVGVPDAVVFAATRSRPAATQAMTRVEIPAAKPQPVWLVEPIEVKQRFLEVRVAQTHAVIAVLEVLSPKNKRSDGRVSYLKKRQEILASQTHLVEIDLIRAHAPLPMAGVEWLGDYRILVSNAAQRPMAELYSFGLRDLIPIFSLPLRPDEAPVSVELQPLLQQVYDEANLDLRIDYQQAVPDPALSERDRAWVVDRCDSEP
jgi:hypothetical protein